MSYQQVYQLDILNSSRSYLATFRTLVPIDKEGHFLSYTQRLSDHGVCKFRVPKDEPLLESEGDILQPFTNHVRVKRYGHTVWQGVIVKNPQRNKRFIEVEAYSYLYLFSRTLIKHDPTDGNGGENYRNIKSGTLASNVTTFVNEAITRMGRPLTGLTIGTVENPNFPADYKDSTGAALTGAWTFSNNFSIRFDYRDLLYVLTVFGMYANADFEITNDFVFNFQSHIGRRTTDMTFTYGEYGNIEDYNAPLDGDQMANFLQGVAADNQNLIIHAEQSDAASIAERGEIDGVAAYGDVKNINLLRSRLRAELTQVKSPDPELHFFANHRAYPLGQYGIGDVVKVVIQDGAINVNTTRRIVGIDVKVHATGKEQVRILTNKPREDV